MKTKAIVLGCGLVGATMARDLAADADFDVAAADVNKDSLRKLKAVSAARTVHVDLDDPSRVQQAVADFDVVLGALPSNIGLQTLQAVIDVGKPYCDISFTPEDALELDDLAKKKGVTAVVDCGVSPGLSNMIVGHVYRQLDDTERAVIYVGGLPKERHWPYEYKAPFAPSDVIEVYTRPARIVEHGQIVVRPALSESELIEFSCVGTLEAFNTDGLRSLLTTVKIPNLKEKTLRYPGHVELMRVLREIGLFGTEEVDVNGTRVRPRDVTTKLMFPKWTFNEGEEEFTVLRVVVEGLNNAKRVRYTYDLYDEYDRENGTSSMARTTGFPCVIVARLLAKGEFSDPGVFAPESLANREGIFDHVVSELSARNVNLRCSVEYL